MGEIFSDHREELLSQRRRDLAESSGDERCAYREEAARLFEELGAVSSFRAGNERGATRVEDCGVVEVWIAFASISMAWPASGGVTTVAARAPVRTQA